MLYTKTLEDEVVVKLEPYAKRGDYYAARTNDGKFIFVNWGSAYQYPIGDTVGMFPIEHIPELIAVLKAALTLKE